MAVQMENFEEAKRVKQEMDHIRLTALTLPNAPVAMSSSRVGGDRNNFAAADQMFDEPSML